MGEPANENQSVRISQKQINIKIDYVINDQKVVITSPTSHCHLTCVTL